MVNDTPQSYNYDNTPASEFREYTAALSVYSRLEHAFSHSFVLSSAGWIVPPALAPGARVALVAPAGPLRGEEDLCRAKDNVLSCGWEPVVGENVLLRQGYFAGDDARRISDLNGALRGARIDGIWLLRGGYGALRLLRDLDYDALIRYPKAIIGYSDITALHSAIAVRARMVTFHGPTARAELPEFTRNSLVRAVSAGENSCGKGYGARVLHPGIATGRLAGGNLALLAALRGTPFAQSFDGAILILEDINEATYRVDRMLRQLVLSGALAGCRAIAFGHCTACAEESDDGARTLDDVLLELSEELDVPCVRGIPVGHIADQWTVPLGAIARLDASSEIPVLDVTAYA